MLIPHFVNTTPSLKQQSVPTKCRSLVLKQQLGSKECGSPVLRREPGPPKKILKCYSTGSVSTTNKSTPSKTLTIVRGDSCSLIDIKTYIGSLGSVEKIENVNGDIFPHAIINPKPRRMIILTQKSGEKKDRQKAELLILVLSLFIPGMLCIVIVFILSSKYF